MVEVTEVDKLQFKWGKKRGMGGKNKDVQFYESFTYDGLDYTLYDDVYLYKEGERQPYLGKLIKIWENADKSKKVKVLWFFLPCEISSYLVVELAHPKEVFLACGEGVGLANVNPLEAIAGKCNVVYISKDSRNPQPSGDELRMADYLFYRTFDVGKRIILDKIDVKIAGIDVKFFFNRVGSPRPPSVHNLGLDDKHVSENAVSTNGRTTLCGLSSSNNQFPESDKQQELRSLVGEKLAANDRQDAAFISKSASSLQDEEKSGVNMSSAKPNFSPREKPVSGAGTESGLLTKTNDRQGNISCMKIGLSHEGNENTSGEKMDRVGKSFVNQVKVDEKLKSVKRSGELNERPHKKAKLDGSVKVSDEKNNNKGLKLNRASDGNNSKPLPNIDASEHKSIYAMDTLGTAKDSSKTLKVDDKLVKPTDGKLPKQSKHPNDSIKTGDKTLKVTSRPEPDRSKWFTEPPWEERIRDAHEHGTLVLFENLDPTYTSGDVEYIVGRVFKEKCSARMLQRTKYSSPHSGQAFAIFKTSEIAERVITKLDEGCLLLQNRRPLVAFMANPCFRRKQATYAGHLILDKLKFQREMKEALSTSHCSQPNTLEYDMAMEWCLLVERLDLFWRNIYKRQEEEIRNLKANLKSK